MGCHYSASLYASLNGNQGRQLTAELSWPVTPTTQLAGKQLGIG
jgi:hypothetical protein